MLIGRKQSLFIDIIEILKRKEMPNNCISQCLMVSNCSISWLWKQTHTKFFAIDWSHLIIECAIFGNNTRMHWVFIYKFEILWNVSIVYLFVFISGMIGIYVTFCLIFFNIFCTVGLVCFVLFTCIIKTYTNTFSSYRNWCSRICLICV